MDPRWGDVMKTIRNLSDTQMRSLVAQFADEVAEQRVELARREKAKGREITVGDEKQFAKSVVQQLIAGYIKRTYDEPDLHELSEDDRLRLRTAVLDQAFHNGQLIATWNNHPDAANMTVSGANNARLELGDGRIVELPPVAISSSALFAELSALASITGVKETTWDPTQPELELILDDGTRLTALNWSVPDCFVTLRRPTMKGTTIDALVANGTLSPRLSSFLSAAMPANLKVMIGGNMNAGKTVLLRGIASTLPKDSHLVTVESQRELLLHEFPEIYGQWITAMDARRPNAEGEGERKLADCIRSVQRSSPSFVLVGEVRGGEEAQAYLTALQQGYSLAGTIHCNSSLNAVEVLAQYYEEGSGARYETALRRAASNIDIAVYVEQLPNGKRVVKSVRHIIDYQNGVVRSEELWQPDPEGRRAATMSTDTVFSKELLDAVMRAGYDPSLPDGAPS